MKVATVSEMRNLDKTAIEKYGIKDELLMENAGLALYSVILSEFGIAGKKFAVICGVGNNGGDGLVVARKIHSMGGKPQIIILSDPAKYKGAAKLNYEIARKIDLPMQLFQSMDQVKKEIFEADAVIDAIFGTGLDRDVGGHYRDVIAAINDSGKPVFSVDIPSGINGDTGKVMGIAVRADYTATFGLPKLGNLFYPGFDYCGELFVTHISFPRELYNNESLKIEVNAPLPLPDRSPAGHKGTFGDVLFVAGAANYFGAPYFSALSFMKAGGGYARLASPKSVVPFIGGKGSEIVFAPMPETNSGSLALASESALLEIAEKVDMVVIGPGMSLNQETQELARRLVSIIEKPVLIDGDGLTAISADTEILKNRKAPTILTPHPGEMARLAGKTIAQVDDEKIELLQEKCDDWNAFIVLKGAHSLIGCPGGKICINLSGNSGMGTAGSGDVLTGTIAAMYGLGLPIREAVKAGVFIHGFSGDLAAEAKGEDGITAQDILNYLPFAVRAYREQFEEIFEDYYGKIFVV